MDVYPPPDVLGIFSFWPLLPSLREPRRSRGVVRGAVGVQRAELRHGLAERKADYIMKKITVYLCTYVYIYICMCMCICIRICIMYMYNVYVYVYVYIHHGYVDGMKTMSINRNQLFWCKQKGTRVLNGSGRNLSYGVSILLNTVPPFFKRLRWQ